MATIRTKAARVVDEEQAPKARPTSKYASLAQWVLGKTDGWRTWRDSNYQADWDSFERLWRGKWSVNEQQRASERSKIVTPALSEAVENAAAEIEEAVFGRGADFFDLETDEELFEEPDEQDEPQPAPQQPGMMGMPNMGAPQPNPGMPPMPMAPMAAAVQRTVDPAEAVETTRASLRLDLARSDFASNCAEVVLHSAVFGTGFGEIVTIEKTCKRPTADGLGSTEETYDIPSLRAVSPRNVLIDPNAKRIEDGLGIAIEEQVSLHLLLQQQKNDKNFEKDVELKAPVVEGDDDIDGDRQKNTKYEQDKVHVIRWYGLVPTKLLYPEKCKNEDGEECWPTVEEAEDGDYTEAIIILTNKRDVAKAVANPSPKGDRPVVYFPWDVVPGRLHGRGICEKGFNPQKILDTEVRARLDGLALTWAPMMGIDATRVPRGMSFQVQPGKSILTNGDPETVLRPIKFGQLDPNHWQNLQALQAMVGQATGSVDASQMASNIGDARSGATSMAMAPVIKRYKRTLTRFFDLFLMPTLDKIVSRSQQAMPKRYPAVGLHIRPASTMGIMQREYETSQLTSLLATLQPGTPEHRAILMGVVSNTSIPNREKVMKLIASAEQREAMMAQAMQHPEMQAMQAQAAQLQMGKEAAQTRKFNSEAALNEVKAQLEPEKMKIDAVQVATKGMYSVPEAQQQSEFDRRIAIVDRELQGEKIQADREDSVRNERIAQMQMHHAEVSKERDRQHKVRVELIKAHSKVATAAAKPQAGASK